MQLAYLDPHPVPDDCPEALQILHTVDALGQIGVRVTLVTPAARPGVTAQQILPHGLSPNVTLAPLPDLTQQWWFPFRSNKPFYFLAARALTKLNADAVLVRNLKMAEHLLRVAPRVPLFFETHEWFAQSFREDRPTLTPRARRKLAALERREGAVYRGSRGLIGLTRFLIDDIRSAYQLTTPAAVAPDGVDLRQCAPFATPAPAHSPPQLLYLGSLHSWKGVNLLIEAMTHLTQPAQLKIVGGNAQRIAELQQLARTLKVADRVHFAGPCPPAERFAVIHEAEVCLLPLTETSIASRYTSPLKLFEYLALGKPVVVSDLPTMRVVLEPEVHALLAPPNDARAFAAAIDRLLADQALRARLGAAARRRAQDFSWEHRAQVIRDFIVHTLSAR
jgi:glycosyltransferase involved in cell wall biosynthesis